MTDVSRPNPTPEQAARLQELVQGALERPAAERAAYIERECPDESMRERVRAAVAERESAQPTVSDPAWSSTPPRAAAAKSTVNDPTPRPSDAPARIGDYRIIREIGRGGMGVVYLAAGGEELRFRRHVAIKILKRGMDTDDVLRRFRTERQVLAALNHPGIARLHHAGETADGLPYFVMEYVEGLPLDEYCDTRRLGIDDRLKLFQSICAAVHHAHQNLVVHRDLKPGNILVTPEGAPKLLDFGIAKLLNRDLALGAHDPTAPEQRVMTPRYASPEQVRGNPITTASDIYSLGVLLYELLSGHAPYEFLSTTRPEIERVICEQEPERPSTAISRTMSISTGVGGSTTTVTADTVSRTRDARPDRLRRRLVGDLDNIVLKALRKEPQRRYVSAQELADDIDRHLDGLPVRARPDTFAYRTTKFVRRHRAAVAAASVFVTVLAMGIVGTASGWRHAEEGWASEQQLRQEVQTERDRAEALWEEGRAVARAMFDVYDEIEELDGAIGARQTLTAAAQDYLEGLRAHAGEDPQLLGELYRTLARIHNPVRGASREGLDQALGLYDKALEYFKQAPPDDPEAQRSISLIHRSIGDIQRRTGHLSAALESYRIRLRIAEALLADDPAGERARRDVAVALMDVGTILGRIGESDEALRCYERSLETRRQLLADDPADLSRQRDVRVALVRVGARHEKTGRLPEAIARYEEAAQIATRLVATNPYSTRLKRDWVVAQLSLAHALTEAGRARDAVGPARDAVQAARQRLEDNADDIRAVGDVAWACEVLGDALAAAGHWEEARSAYGEMHELAADLSQRDPSDVTYQSMVADANEHVARAAMETGDLESAMRSALFAVNGSARLVEAEPADVERQLSRSRAGATLGLVLERVGRLDEARRELDTALFAYRRAHAQAPEDHRLRIGLAETAVAEARVHTALGDQKSAAEVADEGLRALEGCDDQAASQLRAQLSGGPEPGPAP